MSIDADCGVTIRRHPSGIWLNMYKDEPGVFLNDYGEPVNNQLAAEAGFDVAKLKKLKERQERIAAAIADIDKEYEAQPGAVVERHGDFAMVTLGKNRYNILDVDGKVLNEAPLSRKEAERIITMMVAGEQSDETPAKE